MNALMLFGASMPFVYLPWDLFAKPVAEDAEVWFGIMLTGWAAKAAEPLHWAVYAAGTYGFYRMRPWMWPWAAIYVALLRFLQPPGLEDLLGVVPGPLAPVVRRGLTR